MNEITQITPQKKGDRLNIFLDGNFAFAVDYATAVKFALKDGKVLAQKEIAQIQDEEGNVAAFNRALKYAVKKTVSQRQMQEYLLRNGYSVEAAQKAIQKLMEYGYINDEQFCKAYVSTYSNARGAKRLAFELKQAGVDEETISKTLCEVDDCDACMSCIQKYKRTHSIVDRQKLIGYLMYRGFSYDDINDCINRSEL